MKLNWGTGIAIFIVIFVLGILTLVFKSSMQRIDLVSEDYYPRELKYQDEIDAMNRALSLSEEVFIQQDNNHVTVVFPKSMLADSIKGKVDLYRPSDKRLDLVYEIKTDTGNVFRIQKSQVRKGKYEIFVDWKYWSEHYLIKQELLVY